MCKTTSNCQNFNTRHWAAITLYQQHNVCLPFCNGIVVVQLCHCISQHTPLQSEHLTGNVFLLMSLFCTDLSVSMSFVGFHYKAHGIQYFKAVFYLLQSVYSSLLVTPLGGGLNCQPSWISVNTNSRPTSAYPNQGRLSVF